MSSHGGDVETQSAMSWMYRRYMEMGMIRLVEVR